MRKNRNAVLWIVVGFIAGIAAVVSCDNTGLVLAQQDMAGSCAGSCTVSGSISVQQPVEVTATQPLPVSVTAPNPVPISGEVAVTASQPLPVSGTVAISAIATPVQIAQPIDVNLKAPTITVAQPMKVLSADSDPAQLSSGMVGGSTTQIATGPFVVTALIPPNQGGLSIGIGPGTSCSAMTTTLSYTFSSGSGFVGGFNGRLLVPSGSVACASANNGSGIWTGFAPY